MVSLNWLPEGHHQQLLGYPREEMPRRVKLEVDKHLDSFGLSEAKDGSESIVLPLPQDLPTAQELAVLAAKDLVGPVIDNLEAMQDWGTELPPGHVYPFSPGFYRSNGYQWHPCDGEVLNAKTLVLDFETVEVTPGRWLPYLMVAYDGEYWYLWIGDVHRPKNLPRVLRHIGKGNTIANHNCQYDRAYLGVEYNLEDSGNRFFDTMSAFIAVRGMSNQQRSCFLASEEDGFGPQWTSDTSTNGLSAVFELYEGTKISKALRDEAVKGGISYIQENLQSLIRYCLVDVQTTVKVFQHVYPELKVAQPHPASWCGQLLLGSAWLPLSPERFPGYYDRAERIYQEKLMQVREVLVEAAIAAVDQDLPGLDYKNVGWEGKSDLPVSLPEEDEEEVTKPHSYLNDPRLERFRYYGKGLPGLLPHKKLSLPKYLSTFLTKPSLHSRLVPYILQTRYKGSPVFWEGTAKEGGWCYGEPPVPVPHQTKAGKRVTDLFTKDFLKLWEAGVLEAPGAYGMLDTLMSTLVWTSVRKRIRDIHWEEPEGFPVTLPQLLVTGTVTRRAADKLWQVAANPKAKKIGTELKSMVQAPPGYSIVGADVDQEELWIASLMGDSLTGYSASTPLGVSVLVGNKKDRTEMHSKIADMLGMSRDLAKNLNYGAIYGLSLKGAIDYIQMANAAMPLEEVKQVAESYLGSFKGTKSYGGTWVGGLASEAFNKMASIIRDPCPESPVLKAHLSKALRTKDYATTRGNWTVQTSGVDFRDLLITFATWLFRRYGVRGRLLETIHDEIRYLVLQGQEKLAAYLLQVAHVYTRAMFIDAFGMDGIPTGIAWFSGVDVDTVLRKDPLADQVTPSQPDPIAPGYTLSPSDLVDIASVLR